MNYMKKLAALNKAAKKGGAKAFQKALYELHKSGKKKIRVKRNPSRKFKSSRGPIAARAAKDAAKLRPVARAQIGHVFAPYSIQVRRGRGWFTLGQFRTKEIAEDYGYALAAKYPRAKIRIHWPDNLVKKNPAPRDSRDGAEESEIREAAKRFEDFTGHRATKGKRVRISAPKVGFAIGPVLGVAYVTTRDGKRERYFHEFRTKSRPLLAASSDGTSLHMLGGAYEFTDRGIEDR